MDQVPVALLNGIGVVGVVVLIGWFIWTGRLVPKRFYDDIVHDRNEALASGRIKDSQIAEKDRQLEHMGEVGRTMKQVLSAVQKLNDDEGPR